MPKSCSPYGSLFGPKSRKLRTARTARSMNALPRAATPRVITSWRGEKRPNRSVGCSHRVVELADAQSGRRYGIAQLFALARSFLVIGSHGTMVMMVGNEGEPSGS